MPLYQLTQCIFLLTIKKNKSSLNCNCRTDEISVPSNLLAGCIQTNDQQMSLNSDFKWKCYWKFHNFSSIFKSLIYQKWFCPNKWVPCNIFHFIQEITYFVSIYLNNKSKRNYAWIDCFRILLSYEEIESNRRNFEEIFKILCENSNAENAQ